MKIYTRVGDEGNTALFGGQRVSKNALRVRAYGAVDEANSFIGFAAVSPDLEGEIAASLTEIMSDLFDLGAELATPPARGESLKGRLDTRVDDTRVTELEGLIDRADTELDPLTTFVLPTGTDGAARLHLARTVARRAEREVVSLRDAGEDVRDALLAYLNRLSDLLFVYARLANKRAGKGDVPWQARKARD